MEADSLVIDRHIHAPEPFGDSRVAEDIHAGGQEQHRSHCYAKHRFKDKKSELFEGDEELFIRAAQEEIDDQKDALADKEEVADEGIDRYGKRKCALFVFLHQLFKAYEHYREERCGIVEMVEKDVIDLKSRAGIQQCAHKARRGVIDKAADIGIGENCRYCGL